MGSIRNREGEVVIGRGAELTPLQDKFLERVREEGITNQGKIAKELNYTSYYRDNRIDQSGFAVDKRRNHNNKQQQHNRQEYSVKIWIAD